MATDYAEKEREFVTGLKGDTGRDLTDWMQAISQSGLAERNAIIDWLRQKGFTFARASWLQRIHHNGGKLIYADEVAALELAEASERAARAAPPVALAPTVATPPVRNAEPAAAQGAAPNAVIRPAPAAAPQLWVVASSTAPAATAPLLAPVPALPDDVQAFLAAAKGLRPLALLALGEIARALPQITFSVSPPLVMLSGGAPFAALLPGPKELRLYGTFSTGDGFAKRTEVTMRASVPFPQVAILNDARQVNAILLAHVRAAYEAARD
jgi:hypothetical protein